MTGPEHYRKAEEIISELDIQREPHQWADRVREGIVAAAIAGAQVHATLALAAAMAPRPPGRTAHDDWRLAIYGSVTE